jgi:hypothetical protein
LTGALQRLYRARVKTWQNEIYDFCHGRRIHYFPLETSASPDRFLLFELRRRGLVR